MNQDEYRLLHLDEKRQCMLIRITDLSAITGKDFENGCSSQPGAHSGRLGDTK